MREYCYSGIGTIIGDLWPKVQDRVDECLAASQVPVLQRSCRDGADVSR